MKFIIKPRGYGKTTDLIRLSAQTGKTILCANRNQVKFTQNKAKGMNLLITTPLSIDDNLNGYDLSSTNFLVDDAECMLVKLLGKLGIHHIDTIAMTVDNSI